MIMAKLSPPEIPPCPADYGRHQWLMDAAWACRRRDMTAAETIDYLARHITRRAPSREIEQAVEKVFSAVGLVRAYCPPAPRTSYTLSKLEKVARGLDGFGAEELEAKSPIRPDNRTPASFLQALYAPGERVLVFSRYKSQGQAVWERKEEPFDAGALDSFIKPPEGTGAWFLAAPITGEWINLERLKSEHNPEGRTRRAEECVTSFRFLVLESDSAPADLWIAALAQLPLPIVAVYSSGGRSIHALVRIDAKDGANWRAIKTRIAPGLVTLGADKDAMTAVRLTRLPFCYRAEKDAMQQLYYLNPGADSTPIYQLSDRPTFKGENQ
jgi:hypothetical protein